MLAFKLQKTTVTEKPQIVFEVVQNHLQNYICQCKSSQLKMYFYSKS